jgi:fructose-1,6-bisphosphatase
VLSQKVVRFDGNKKLVQTGDIFDRGAEGVKILDRVKQLRTQGADIELLIGNHEDWMIRAMLDDVNAMAN